LRLNGKTVLYAKRSASDQLRKIHGITITIASKETLGDLYVVTARARTPDGREDEDMGAVDISRAKGENLANAMMKAVTKAKRRVTLSVCGLSMLDETEVDSVDRASHVRIDHATGEFIDANPHSASAHRTDETVQRQALAADNRKSASRELRDAWQPEVERLRDEGTAEELERWCYHHGAQFDDDVVGSDRNFVWTRIMAAGKRLDVHTDTLKAWLAAREKPASGAHAIPEEYDALFGELLSIEDPIELYRWCTHYRDDLRSLENGAKREALKLIMAAAKGSGAEWDDVEATLRGGGA
jgi:hypothetical protein